jgi:hypothetical protein
VRRVGENWLFSRRALLTSGAGLALGLFTPSLLQAATKRRRDWADAIGAFEHEDSTRSGLFPTFDPFSNPPPQPEAVFLGGMPGLWNAAFDSQGRGFALHGVIGTIPSVTKSYVTRFDPATMREISRVELPFPSGDNIWIYPGSVGVHANGKVYAAYSTRIIRLHPESLAIEGFADLPAPSGIQGSTYNGFNVLSDGTLLLKSHHRKIDCKVQGFRAFIECGIDGLPPSALALVNPETMQVTWSGIAPELIGGRISCVRYRGKEFVYLAGESQLHRMIYRAGRLVPDTSWGPVIYREGQEAGGTAAVAMGDYVVIQNNALPTRTMLGITVVSQRNSQIQFRAKPFADQNVTQSFMPSKVSVDVLNSRIYVGDGHGGTAAFDFSPRTGLTRAWVRPYRTGSFLNICGPPNKRVLIVSDIGEVT